MQRDKMRLAQRIKRGYPQLMVAVSICTIVSTQVAAYGKTSAEIRNADIKFAYIPYSTNLHSQALSPEAVQLAKLLSLTEKLQEISKFKTSVDTKLSPEQSLHLLELKEEVREIIEQTRLEIDYIDSEIIREESAYSELLQAYTDARDRKVDRINAYGFRTNGVLWAVGEALDIPTYSSPKFAIPSGAIGIVAGLVPSAFSLFALRQEHGGRFERDPHPNMLSKIFGYKVTPEIDYPDSIWCWLNSVPPAGTDKTRLKFLINTWQNDININHFTAKSTKTQIDVLTATTQNDLTIRIISDRLVMIRSLHAVILGISRPLLELLMVMRGTKNFE